MGNRNSKPPQLPGQIQPGQIQPRQTLPGQIQPGQTLPGPLNRFSQPVKVNTRNTLPPSQPSKIYDLQFILANPPRIILQPQQNTLKNQAQMAQTTQKLNAIKAKIIEYNKTWNFGNQSNGQPQSLLKRNI